MCSLQQPVLLPGNGRMNRAHIPSREIIDLGDTYIYIMKSIPSKPSADDQAAVRAALDTCCKYDPSVITFFGKKQKSSAATTTVTTPGSKQIPSSVVSTRSEGPLLSSTVAQQPTQNSMVLEEEFC